MITAEDKQGFLLALSIKAANADVPLVSLLQSAISASHDGDYRMAGRTVIASAGNGKSQQILIPDFLKTFTPDDARHMWVALWNIYQKAMATLGLTFVFDPSGASYTDANDASIVNTMLSSDDMTAVTVTHDDFTILGFPTYGPPR